MLPSRIESLAPWALRPTIKALILRPDSPREIPRYMESRPGGTLPRGAGTAYGDACVNPDGFHLSTLNLNKIVAFDPALGQITCQPGVTLRDIIDIVLPHRWFLSVSPGTMFATVGGCLACDVHGKNHHAVGSFASSVLDCDLVTPDGSLHSCSPSTNPELFWATAGGLGQTGVITRLTLQLQPVQNAFIKTRHIATKNLEETFAAIDNHPNATYSVCWIDSLARGKKLGRAVLMLGEHATSDELTTLSPRNVAVPFQLSQTGRLALPFFPPRFCSPALLWRTFNNVYYRANARHTEQRIVHFQPYFYPLDGVAHWNRIFGKPGFLEYQFAIPAANGFSICQQVLEALANSGNGSFLAVIKKFGPANPAPLSFPLAGYTLAVDMRYAGKSQADLLRSLDKKIAEAGGRVYLVKDSRLDHAFLDTMYPQRRLWADFVNTLDPENRFSSALVRRLGLRA